MAGHLMSLCPTLDFPLYEWPHAGSSLSDITTRAVPDGAGFESNPLGPRYRLRGNKMWISSGEHELTENIIHLASNRDTTCAVFPEDAF